MLYTLQLPGTAIFNTAYIQIFLLYQDVREGATPFPGNEYRVPQWSGRLEFNPRSSHTKDSKNGTRYHLA